MLFSPWVVVAALITGGALILLAETLRPVPRHHAAERLPLPLALKVGLCQAVAMVPGVSRSGATILGGVLLGVERRAAAEFSFVLAIPTLLGATVYDLYRIGPALTAGDLLTIAVGFGLAPVTATVAIRALLAFLTRHSFRAFGWYRIALGLAMAAVLLAHGRARCASRRSPPARPPDLDRPSPRPTSGRRSSPYQNRSAQPTLRGGLFRATPWACGAAVGWSDTPPVGVLEFFLAP